MAARPWMWRDGGGGRTTAWPHRLLLSEAREFLCGPQVTSAETHRLRARLNQVEDLTTLTVKSPVFAFVHMQLLARDCQWMLARHSAERCS